MASPLIWKVYSKRVGGKREYVAACRFAEDAAAVVSEFDGGVVKCHGTVVFRQGREAIDAADSWVGAACIMRERAFA